MHSTRKIDAATSICIVEKTNKTKSKEVFYFLVFSLCVCVCVIPRFSFLYVVFIFTRKKNFGIYNKWKRFFFLVFILKKSNVVVDVCVWKSLELTAQHQAANTINIIVCVCDECTNLLFFNRFFFSILFVPVRSRGGGGDDDDDDIANFVSKFVVVVVVVFFHH